MLANAIYVMGDDGFIVALVEEFPDITTQGKNIEEARAMVLDAVRATLAANREDVVLAIADRRVIAREVLPI